MRFDRNGKVESQKGTITFQRCSVENHAEGLHQHRNGTAIAPFWFSMEHLSTLIAPFWLSHDDSMLQIELAIFVFI